MRAVKDMIQVDLPDGTRGSIARPIRQKRIVDGRWIGEVTLWGDRYSPRRAPAGAKRRRWPVPKYAARVDRNQAEIVAALREIGASVQHLHAVGRGCPDLIVGWRGQNYMLEVKDGEQEPARRKLTKDEERWHREWAGQVATVETVEQAYAAIGVQMKLWKVCDV